MKVLRTSLAFAALAFVSAACAGMAKAVPYATDRTGSPTASEAAEARDVLERAAAARRAAMDQAVAHWLLESGHFQIIDDPAERAEVAAAMRQRLHDIGIEAELGQCDWMGLVAVGTSRGNLSYGAACNVRIHGQPERPFLICSALYGGLTLVAPELYAHDADFVELFIRRACF